MTELEDRGCPEPDADDADGRVGGGEGDVEIARLESRIIEAMSTMDVTIDRDMARRLLSKGCGTNRPWKVYGIVTNLGLAGSWNSAGMSGLLGKALGLKTLAVIEARQRISDAVDDRIPTIVRLRRVVEESPEFGSVHMTALFRDRTREVSEALEGLAAASTVTVSDYAARTNLTSDKIDPLIGTVLRRSWAHAPGSIPDLEACNPTKEEIAAYGSEDADHLLQKHLARYRTVQECLSSIGYGLSMRQVGQLMSASHGIVGRHKDALALVRSGTPVPDLDTSRMFIYLRRVGGLPWDEARRVTAAVTRALRPVLVKGDDRADSHLEAATRATRIPYGREVDGRIASIVKAMAGMHRTIGNKTARRLLHAAVGGNGGHVLETLCASEAIHERWDARLLSERLEGDLKVDPIEARTFVEAIAEALDDRIPTLRRLRRIVLTSPAFGGMTIEEALGDDQEALWMIDVLRSEGTLSVSDYANRDLPTEATDEDLLQSILKASWAHAPGLVPKLEIGSAVGDHGSTTDRDEIERRSFEFSRRAETTETALTSCGYEVDQEQAGRMLAAAHGSSYHGSDPIRRMVGGGRRIAAYHGPSLVTYLKDVGGFGHAEALSMAAIATRALRRRFGS
jgi:hypothetical protein